MKTYVRLLVYMLYLKNPRQFSRFLTMKDLFILELLLKTEGILNQVEE